MNGLFSKDNLIQIKKHYITSFPREKKSSSLCLIKIIVTLSNWFNIIHYLSVHYILTLALLNISLTAISCTWT